MNKDTELLSRYVAESSESAFTELVQEHLNLVYSAALRETNGNGPLAEDLSQAVFTELARKAHRLVRHPSVAGWLYTTVRHLAANVRRSEQHRRHREEEAQAMIDMQDSPEEVWQRLRPVLDDALHDLNQSDRDAVVLRFLEERSLREVGLRLGLTENAARMRVDRALDKLRAVLARRGINSTSAGLAAALAIGAITPAPAALAATIVSSALATGVATSATTLTLAKLMSMTTIKVGLISTLAVVGVAVPTWQQTRLNQVRSENAQLQAQLAELPKVRPQMEDLQTSNSDGAELQRLRQWQAQMQPELLRLRAMVGLARRANAEAEELRAQLARKSKEGETNLITGAMADAMVDAMQQQTEGKLARLTASLHLSPEQSKAAREILMRQAQILTTGMQQALTGKFNQDELHKMAKGGDVDSQIKALLTAEQQAAYPNYKNEEAAHDAAMAANSELLQFQTTLGLTPEQVDGVYAALYQGNFDTLTGALKPPSTTDQAEALTWVLEQKAKALSPLLTPEQMDKLNQQQAKQAKLIKDLVAKMQASKGSK